eukprot:Plantae.Rhodophyta-Hildenbrandia_rubra.ctg16715.p1 GENE.Plantae.Rhodophyta-Hildenbrandia_rubra.ctg16715~~Plantae.Rhodophyta-Hildenbrandia_rubra.ctg16715.p1  ORF type:complete len:127 (+),score=19.38 Plantae.Rhodophyta-Hildenbrandia_rubra.ctg16715:309-689(+)
MPSSEFRRIFTDLGSVGDIMNIDVSKQQASFTVEGDIGKASLQIQQSDASEEEKGVTITVEEPIKVSASTNYLTVFCKAVPLSGTVVIGLQKDMPLTVEFTLPNESGYLRFFVSPHEEQDQTDGEQ